MRVGKADDQSLSPSPPRGAWGLTPDAQVPTPQVPDPETLMYLPFRALYREDDVTDLREIVPSQTAQGVASTEDTALCKITIQLRPASTSRILREVLPVMASVCIFSCLSTLFGWVLFGVVCHGPHEDGLPDGYVSWTSCETAAGVQGNRHVLTPLGQALDPRSLRLRVSAPKYWCAAAMGVLIARLLRPRDRLAWVIVMAANTVVAASATYNLATWLVVPSLGEADLVDQLTLCLLIFITFGVMFIFESTSLYVIRRSTLQELNDSIPELAASIVVFSLVEILAHAVALLSAVYYHNLMIATHQREKASRYVAVFLLAILNDILAEHVAMQGSLAVLFADSRVFDLTINKKMVLLGWVAQFAAELLVDMASLVVIVSILPVSFQDVAKLSGSVPCMSLLVICSLFVHQATLQVLIREDAFHCA
eukprot:TRINITY_DN18492_c0_g1_i2.p1 TRINITY_DN18492_c0_g1~~TRINITY_DN18492_c0_g1_i2.p1  ORF type:complete len:424 (+),score=41.09 TRINITY_DN18492_c0_g1_i2:163-1434(+)